MSHTISIDANGVTLTNVPVPSGSSGYEIFQYGIPEQRRRRDVETSPYMGGEVEIQSVRDATTIVLGVRVVGATWPAAVTLKTDLTYALTREEFEVTTNDAGVTSTYLCNAADWTGPRDIGLIHSNRWELTFSIPGRPL